jgi:hypothetical protein
MSHVRRLPTLLLAATVAASLNACAGKALRNVALLVTTNGYDPNGRSGQALAALRDRLITFHNTGK